MCNFSWVTNFIIDELRRDMTKRIDQVGERAHPGRESLRDELTHVKS